MKNYTCNELKTKLKSGWAGKEPGGTSEKQPARTYTQIQLEMKTRYLDDICHVSKRSEKNAMSDQPSIQS